MHLLGVERGAFQLVVEPGARDADDRDGEGNGLNNLNPRFFDLNRDGVLDQVDFDRLEVLLGASCTN